MAYAWRTSIDPVSVPPPAGFAREKVRQGEQLAAIGNCAGCHTATGGAAFAGGVPLETPFGTIYGTNITPEAGTGIGAWPEAAFRRALREGVSRDGHLLYPAFPYDHFTRMNDDDIGALYAFVMTRDPVVAEAPRNKLVFPLQFRPLVAGWNLLYLTPGPMRPEPSQSAEWNRGAYLVSSAGHCAACHSPRNALGAEDRSAFLAGGEAEGWHAPALNAESPSPVHWTAQSLAIYLRTGMAPDHALTAGPMQGVVRNLARAEAADVQAMALYLASLMGPPTSAQQAREALARELAAHQSLADARPSASSTPGEAPALALGAKVYANNCAGCHDMGRGISSNAALRLPLAVALHIKDPRNLIHIIQRGIIPADGEGGRFMPPFAGTLTDEELTALLAWMRRQATGEPPWQDLARTVKEAGTTP